MSASQRFYETLERNAKELDNFLICEYFYLNGKKLDISFHDVKPPIPIPLSFIKEHIIKDSVPEDIIFMSEKGEIINKEDEDKTFTEDKDKLKNYYVYSDILYSQRNYQSKNLILNFKKLEEKEEFNIYEYPSEEIKDEEQFYSIILFGGYYDNIKFVNGFLNFLYDVQKEDNFRLKFENTDNINLDNKKEFLKIMNIKHEKGNFKFYCFDFSLNSNLAIEEINELEKIINNGNKDIHIDFIVYNKINFAYEKRIKDKIFDDHMEEIGTQLSKTNYADIISNFFFAEPNMIYSELMYQLRKWLIAYYGNPRPENVYDKSRTDLEKRYKNALLHYCFTDYDKIYETKNGKFEICEFNRIMDGFSKFYEGLLKAPKNNQFQQIRKHFLSLSERFTPMGLLIGEYKNCKLNQNGFEEEKINLEPKMIQLEKAIKGLENLENEYFRLESYFIHSMKKISSNPNLKIPYRTEEFKNIEHPGKKTTTCSVCLCYCHLDCQDKFLKFCKAFDFKFGCKVCPNKCGASDHTFSDFDYPKCNYKTIDELYPNKETDIEEKINNARQHFGKEAYEFADKKNELEKDLSRCKKLVESKESCLKQLSKELDDEVDNFRYRYIHNYKICETFDVEIFKLFMFSFLQPYF